MKSALTTAILKQVIRVLLIIICFITVTMGIVSVACGVCTAFLNLRSGTPNWQVLLFFIVSIVAFVLHIIQSLKLAKCFGKGTGFGLFLILCGPIARLVLGLGKARYIGKQ